jgi:hypothetical protein
MFSHSLVPPRKWLQVPHPRPDAAAKKQFPEGRVPQVALFYLGLLVFSQNQGDRRDVF